MVRPSNLAKKPYVCQRCGRRLIKNFNSSGYFWGCSYYPRCQKTFADDVGKPFMKKIFDFTCPACQSGGLIKYKNAKRVIWICNDTLCKATFRDALGKPYLRKQI
jgi:ssDNA-binding Zn-finger/Zn-ribbon topoisomerase 1